MLFIIKSMILNKQKNILKMNFATIILLVFAYLLLLFLLALIFEELATINEQIKEICKEGKITYNGKPIE